MPTSDRKRTPRQSRITPAGEVGAAQRVPIEALGSNPHASTHALRKVRPGQNVATADEAQASAVAAAAPPPPPRDPELERRIDAARRAVFERGRQEGLLQGRAEGQAQARAAMQAERAARESAASAEADARMQRIARHFATEFKSFESDLADQVLDLGVTLAERLVAMQLTQDPPVIRAVVSECLEMVGDTSARITVRVHPDDFTLLDTASESQGSSATLAYLSDATIEPGGCLLETPDTVLDARLSTRWQRVLASLGMSRSEVAS